MGTPEEELELETAEIDVVVARLLAVTGAAFERQTQLERALRTRIVVEQAKGVLAERFAIAIDEAFELLRRAARSHQLKLHDLASRVVQGRETPPEIEATRARG